MNTTDLYIKRSQFAALKSSARNLGFQGNFVQECRSKCVVPPTTPNAWLDAAKLVVACLVYEAQDGECDDYEPYEVAHGPRSYDWLT